MSRIIMAISPVHSYGVTVESRGIISNIKDSFNSNSKYFINPLREISYLAYYYNNNYKRNIHTLVRRILLCGT